MFVDVGTSNSLVETSAREFWIVISISVERFVMMANAHHVGSALFTSAAVVR